jgi:hypothetical protein
VQCSLPVPGSRRGRGASDGRGRGVHAPLSIALCFFPIPWHSCSPVCHNTFTKETSPTWWRDARAGAPRLRRQRHARIAPDAWPYAFVIV